MVKKKLNITPGVLKNKRKRTKKWIRFAGTKFIKIRNTGWRRPKGIDNPMRRGFRGRGKMVSIGYGSDKRLRFRNRQSGKIRFRIRNVRQLETLLMHGKDYEAVIARQCGARKRKDIVLRAAELGVKVVNRNARLNIVEKE